jgi:hypothetical protein
LHEHTSPEHTHGIFLDFAKMAAHARDLANQFTVKTPSLDTPLKNLSGGNIQKAIMARELSRQPKVSIAAQPTRGVGIGATEYIHQHRKTRSATSRFAPRKLVPAQAGSGNPERPLDAAHAKHGTLRGHDEGRSVCSCGETGKQSDFCATANSRHDTG